MTETDHDAFPSATHEAVEEAKAHRHSMAEDVYAMLIGCTFTAVGVVLLKQAGLVTGSTAGIALILSYLLPLSPTTLMLLVNLPFFLYAARAVNMTFAVKSTTASVGMMGIGLLVPHYLGVSHIDPFFAALFSGTLIGMGVLALARHGAGAGGIGIIALHFHGSRGWNAGRTQMLFDVVILTSAIPVIGLPRVAMSLLSAAAINAVMYVNHRPGRYSGH